MELGRGGEVPTEAQGGPEGGWTRGFWHEGRALADQHGVAMRSGWKVGVVWGRMLGNQVEASSLDEKGCERLLWLGCSPRQPFS